MLLAVVRYLPYIGDKVVLTITSEEFGIEEGQAWVIPEDWDSPENLARGDPVVPDPVEVFDNQIAPITVAGPGQFVLILQVLTVHRLRDEERFYVPCFALEFELAGRDLQRGTAVVNLNSNGLFRVTLFDHMRRPLGHQSLTLSCNLVTVKLTTDEHGAVILLCNPTLVEAGRDTSFSVERI